MTREQENKMIKLIQPLVEKIVKKQKLNEAKITYAGVREDAGEGSVRISLNVKFSLEKLKYIDSSTKKESSAAKWEVTYDSDDLEEQIAKQMTPAVAKIVKENVINEGEGLSVSFAKYFYNESYE